jgi:hypothetical protein
MAVSQQRIVEAIYDCNSIVEVNDFVYIDSSGILQLARADDINTMPAIGVVVKN